MSHDKKDCRRGCGFYKDPTPRRQEEKGPMVKRYEIVHVSDFLKVPDDRLDDCLKEFASAIRAARPMAALVEEVGAAMGTPVTTVFPKMTWIDDHEYRLTFKISEEAEAKRLLSEKKGA